MKYTDTVVPYVLASMHPILHLSLLTTTILLTTINQEAFYEVPNIGSCSDKAVKDFDKINKYHLVGIISFAHLLSIILHYLSELFTL